MNLGGHPLQRTHDPREHKQGHPRLTHTWWGTHMNPRGQPRTVNTYMTQDRTPTIGEHMSHMIVSVHTQANIGWGVLSHSCLCTEYIK